ncbi:hypothetical protein PUN28_019932 [Cardiocondyla obscurior]|uniref:Secreted protein n=1 Tax=Cardiocondyla obscurior TaxID=286306 RepID=A0AAW2EA41_9HYME
MALFPLVLLHPTYVCSFCAPGSCSFRTFDAESIYFFSGFFTPPSRLFPSRPLLPRRAQLLASHMTAGTQLHYRQQLRLEAGTTRGPGAINKPGGGRGGTNARNASNALSKVVYIIILSR